MKGSHYNRAWLVQNTVSEEMKRLIMHRFFGELNIKLPSQLAELVAEPDLINDEIVDSRLLFIQQYEDFKDQVRCRCVWKDTTVLVAVHGTDKISANGTCSCAD